MDVVIIGTGRVGLPLGLSLAWKGLKACGIDINENIRKLVNNKTMPFLEDSYDEIIKKNDFKIYDNYEVVAKTKNIIITVGTPLQHHIETNLDHIKNVLKSISPFLKKGHNIILRSTVTMGTTDYVKKTIQKETNLKVGKEIFVSFCPERIAEGKAFSELQSLPQIIGADEDIAFDNSKNVFKVLTKEIIRTNIKEAELIKLFCNISRYMQFSVVNYLAIVSETYKCDIHKLLNIINKDYPRPIHGNVGFTAGTCLRKDWGMINETIPYADMLISAYKVNEFMPKFLIDTAKEIIGTFENKVVGVLGYTFKMDSDDIRDSLTPKLIRYIEREVPKEIFINEPNLKDCSDFKNSALIKFIGEVDIVFITMNHSVYKKYFDKLYKSTKSGCLFIDLWNVSGNNKMFYRKEE